MLHHKSTLLKLQFGHRLQQCPHALVHLGVCNRLSSQRERLERREAAKGSRQDGQCRVAVEAQVLQRYVAKVARQLAELVVVVEIAVSDESRHCRPCVCAQHDTWLSLMASVRSDVMLTAR